MLYDGTAEDVYALDDSRLPPASGILHTFSAQRQMGQSLQGAHGRVFNFSAGPATLPVPVLEQTQADLINYQGSGMSVMEMSHRQEAPYAASYLVVCSDVARYS